MNPYAVSAYLRPHSGPAPAPAPAAPSWRDSALCAEVDPDLHFPEKGGAAEPAKAVCRSCPSRIPCLRYALSHYDEGIWGGYSERERYGIRRRIKAGGSLADIVADDDEAAYQRLESAPGPVERQRGYERAHRARNAAKVAAITEPREAAA